MTALSSQTTGAHGSVQGYLARTFGHLLPTLLIPPGGPVFVGIWYPAAQLTEPLDQAHFGARYGLGFYHLRERAPALATYDPAILERLGLTTTEQDKWDAALVLVDGERNLLEHEQAKWRE